MTTYLLYHAPWQLLMIAIFVQSSISYIKLPDIGIDWLDKILHFLCYGILGLLMARSFLISKYKKYQNKYWQWSIIFCSLYGLSDEIHQRFIPGRLASFSDWLADTLGVVIFILIYKWYKSRH